MKIKILLSLLIISISCCQNNYEKECLSVLYMPGFIDTSVPISCRDMYNDWNTSSVEIDTCWIDYESFAMIKAFMMNCSQINSDIECDARIMIKLDTICLSIDNDTCIFNLQGKLIESDMEIVYLIKWKSGYYNYFELDDLKTLPEIKLFGIPDDYKYKVSRLGKPKKQIIRKILYPRDK